MLISKNTVDSLTINNKLFFREAKNLGFNVRYIKETYCVQIHYANQYYYFVGPTAPFNCAESREISLNKDLMNQILQKNNIPVPKAICITRQDFEAFSWSLGNLTYPVVAKPTSYTWGGDDVLCNIKSPQLLHKYLEACFKTHHMMSIEEFHGGLKSYRVYMLENKVIGLLERIPAYINGDGEHNIKDLIELENKKRIQQKGIRPIRLLDIGEETKIKLDELGVSLQTIPNKNQHIPLKYSCNWGVTKSLNLSYICKENVELLSRAAKALHMEIVGFDVCCEDISKPIGRADDMKPSHTRGVIIEANYFPDACIHESPIIGKPQRVARKVLIKLGKKHPVRFFFQRLLRPLGIGF